jgi:hypothetical protein
VVSKKSHREGMEERREASAREGWGFGGAEMFAHKVKVTESDG